MLCFKKEVFQQIKKPFFFIGRRKKASLFFVGSAVATIKSRLCHLF
ncbi:hypothetical protein CHCC20331_2208 [Bacillus paralicheniformis]|nr:hypothetical protein CHCC5027_0969 [Bacillus paralicheniformis]TWJ61087.1 hypothetical protein CHCC5021_3843 [Bacillus paralicheniformis]TWK24009.1 hypothetical protein CHCC20372_4416 [Bacillus paralicheniformis]TWK40054.1 hypothetical protein CHCC20348_1460 [Bacillus paralicheniformis]TWK84789.1 hypothetical protein CHCC20331_2208 [Bacillus paralicheniformis]